MDGDIARTLQRQIDLIERGSLNATLPEHQRTSARQC
jgi:hypothetical protein